MRRVSAAVPMEEAERRAIAYLRSARAAGERFVKPSSVAFAIWPDATFTAQGGAGAAGRILARMKKQGIVRWNSNGSDWGWTV